MSGVEHIAQGFASAHPDEVARRLDSFAVSDVAGFLTSLPDRSAADVARQMAPNRAAQVLEAMAPADAGKLVSHMPLQSGAFILRRLSDKARQGLLDLLPRERRGPLQRLLTYAENSAGAAMNPLVVTLYVDSTAEEALAQVRKHAELLGEHIPVVDREYGFAGVVGVRELLRMPPKQQLRERIRTDMVHVRPRRRLDRVLVHPHWFTYTELPVVDGNGTFLGMLQREHLSASGSGMPTSARAAHASGTAGALGELFWMGMSAVIAGAAALMRQESEPTP
jgi:Mg/Co/Ni transporter MgtE